MKEARVMPRLLCCLSICPSSVTDGHGRHIEEVIKNGPRTPDLGGTASTTEVGQAIAAQIAGK